MIRIITLILISTTFILAGCGPSKIEVLNKKISDEYAVTESIIKTLGNNLDKGYLSNSAILKQYAEVARIKKPKYKNIIDTLEAEGSTKGATYKSLLRRLGDVKKKIDKGLKTNNYSELSTLGDEISSLKNAGSLDDFNVMLVDAVNVLAGFTDGELPKLRELQFTDASESSAVNGSEYVGNSNYGSWKTDSSGNSFWAWYGQYAFFSAMFNGPSYYGSWSGNRPPSYYHDYGRDRYSSPTGRSNQQATNTRAKKQFSKQGKSFQSPYAKSAATRSSVQSAKKSGTVAKAGGFKSKYSKNNSTFNSKNLSSVSKKSGYNSRSSGRSRSSFGGK
jgi:hypothetical protein